MITMNRQFRNSQNSILNYANRANINKQKHRNPLVFNGIQSRIFHANSQRAA